MSAANLPSLQERRTTLYRQEVANQRLRRMAVAGCTDSERFVLEIEFVQCLANPRYLEHLAQTRVLEDPSFINYLKYLQYWKKPEYSRYIIYPQCLHFLDLLQSAQFRNALKHPRNTEFIHAQQLYFWSHYRNTRLAAVMPSPDASEDPADTAVPPVAPFAPGVEGNQAEFQGPEMNDLPSTVSNEVQQSANDENMATD
ncbi:hypothetical protein CYMTET_41138 [Cymbomonas tetramitiformis]|uniref:Mediator of RNA polymerase II transcription subunit 31 n=1 Tax=Cymbomonas tetramitiformis TaxID=36881 RepID=A0AAE0C8U7_9CHLO|nr:hypothetical protein CYMTET_41138 [Cymbomonas tetramitiformis]